MKLQQIQYFCAACRYGNITRAAGELHVSQPSISMAIRDLEKEFGLLLIQRNNKGFAMTKEGMYFYEKAEILLEQADELAQMMRDMGNQRKRINLGDTSHDWDISLVPVCIRNFGGFFPDIVMNSREGGSRESAGDAG